MKFIIIGLGHFGSSLGQKLAMMGHEVIGVDNNMVNVEDNKGLLTHTVCLNTSDSQAVTSLPIADADAVIVCIGLNEGANLLATANMKLMKAKHLICRAISPLHRTILEAMQVDDIVYLEEETAHRWAKKLNMKRAVDVYEITGEFNLVEVVVPNRFIGKTLQESLIRSKYNLLVLSTIKITEQKNVIGVTRKVKQIQEMASAQTILNENDIMVMYGKTKDFESFFKDV